MHANSALGNTLLKQKCPEKISEFPIYITVGYIITNLWSVHTWCRYGLVLPPRVKCVVKFGFWMRKARLQSQFIVSCVLYMVQELWMSRWVWQFKDGRTDGHNEQCCTWPSDAVNENSLSAVWFILENDWRVIISIIQRTLREDLYIDISFGSIHKVI